jgi:Histidine kinase-, DNA gyrase B-, and HSP90-like ATPase
LTQTALRQKLNIRPATSVYGTYRRLSYRPWYAIAEFVDNSTQNYLDHRDELKRTYKREGKPGKLRIVIDYDHEGDKLVVRDNANGMDIGELTRAVTLDRPPPDTSGRCEYGMGLKTAACWFGRTWTIDTCRLGSGKMLSVTVNVPNLVQKHVEEVTVQESRAKPEEHFTEITIRGLYKPIHGRTSGRIHAQLGSMYRVDLRTKEAEIFWNTEPVSYEEPTFLEEKLPGGVTNVWKEDFKLTVPWEGEKKRLSATGWVGVRTPGSQRDAGFALLRRGRVIVGGPGEGYKPVEIFGQGNTFRSQRLVGEIEMDDWPVTQAKDAFDWSGELEESFIEELKRACRGYMEKAEGYRERRAPISESDMKAASQTLQEVFADERFAKAVEEEILMPVPAKTPELAASDAIKLQKESQGPVKYHLKMGDGEWLFRLFWQEKMSDAHWMEVSYPQDTVIDIYLNTGHPFFRPYLDKPAFLELLQKVVVSLALAEKMARRTAKGDLIAPSDFRSYMNRVLRRASEIEADSDV